MYYFAYGNYVHAGGEVTVSVTKSPLRSEIGTYTGFTQQMTISGVLQANSADELTAALLLLEAAYSSDGYDAGLYADNGTPTAHVMLSALAQGGNRIVSLTYPKTDGPQYTTFRNYEIVIEARYLTGNRNQIVGWNETLTFTGTGGPRFIMQQPLVGYPQKWQVAARTPYLCTQSGMCLMLLDYPAPATPIFPADEHLDRRRIDVIHPQIINGTLQNYGRSWNYEFESISPLYANPTPPQ